MENVKPLAARHSAQSSVVEIDPEEVGLDARRLRRVRAHLLRDIELGKYDGAALVGARHGEVVLDIREGYSDRSIDAKLKRDSVFHTMSLGKQFTATVALKLVEDGYFSLTTPISAFLPEFRAGKEKMSVYHILTQRSGLPDIVDLPEVSNELRRDMAAYTQWSYGKPAIAPPGVKLAYSRSLGHTILGSFMERATGRSFKELVEQELFKPLGMMNTSVGPRDDLVVRLCPSNAPYRIKSSDKPADRAFQKICEIPRASLKPGTISPGGGFFTTADDVHLFAEMLRPSERYTGPRVLSPAMIELVSQNQTGNDPFTLMTPFLDVYNLVETPGNIGIGFYTRGTSMIHGPFGVLNSPNTIAGAGMGSTLFWSDPRRDMTFVLLTVGLLDEAANFIRCQVLSDLFLSSLKAVA